MSVGSVSTNPSYYLKNYYANMSNGNGSIYLQQARQTTAAQPSECTDGKDDGKISFWEKLKSGVTGIVKSVVNTVKDIVTNPGKLLLTIGTVALCIACPAVGVALAAAGVVGGVVKVGKGIAQASGADTDAEAKAAWEDIGSGTFQVAVSVAGVKGGLKAMKNVEGSAMAGLSKGAGAKATAKAYLKDLKTQTGELTGKIASKVKTGYSSVKETGVKSNIAKAEKAAYDAIDKGDDVAFAKAYDALEKAQQGKGAISEGLRSEIRTIKGTLKTKATTLKDTVRTKAESAIETAKSTGTKELLSQLPARIKQRLQQPKFKALIERDPRYQAANEAFYKATNAADEAAALAQIKTIVGRYETLGNAALIETAGYTMADPNEAQQYAQVASNPIANPGYTNVYGLEPIQGFKDGVLI